MRTTRQTRKESHPTGMIEGLGKVLTDIFRLALVGFLGAIFFLIRYILRTPQTLRNTLPGEERLFRWTYGHVFYKVLGAQDAPPLVLIHAPELAASSYEMRGIMEPLAQRYRVYALDLPGFGLSDHPHVAYTGEFYVSFLQDFLSSVVQRPATLVASGLSANYAVAIASNVSELCERLVLLSPTALFTDGKVRHWYTPLLQNPLIGLCLYAFLTTRIVLHAMLTRGQNAKMLSEMELDHYFAAAHQFGAEHPVIAYMTGDLSLDISRQLETLQQPMLIIWGLHAMQQALHTVRIRALQNGASAPLLALTDTSSATTTDTADALKRVILLDDVGRHVQETNAAHVATDILASTTSVQSSVLSFETSHSPDSPQQTPSQGMEELVADAYTDKEESPVSASSLQGAIREARSDADVLEAIEREEEAQGVQEPELVEPVDSVDSVEPQASQERKNVQTGEQIEAYCVKCKQKRIMENPTDTTTKNGRRAKEGSCPVCGTRLFRFIAS